MRYGSPADSNTQDNTKKKTVLTRAKPSAPQEASRYSSCADHSGIQTAGQNTRMADLEEGNADETTPLEIDNDDSEVVAKAVEEATLSPCMVYGATRAPHAWTDGAASLGSLVRRHGVGSQTRWVKSSGKA